jgi:hypothetical protein
MWVKKTMYTKGHASRMRNNTAPWTRVLPTWERLPHTKTHEMININYYKSRCRSFCWFCAALPSARFIAEKLMLIQIIIMKPIKICWLANSKIKPPQTTTESKKKTSQTLDGNSHNTCAQKKGGKPHHQ